MGERPEEAGELATLSPPASVPARGSGGSAPLFRPGRGNREGAREEVGWAGGAAAAQFGAGGQWGEAGLFPLFFLFLCLGSVFCFLFICLFPFLFYFI